MFSALYENLVVYFQIIWSERLSTISPVLVRIDVLEKTIPGVSILYFIYVFWIFCMSNWLLAYVIGCCQAHLINVSPFWYYGKCPKVTKWQEHSDQGQHCLPFH